MVDQELEQALQNTEPLFGAAEVLVDSAVAQAARDAGRTQEEQWERMGDHFAYQAIEVNPRQKQLDDYGLAGEPSGVTA